VRDNWPALVLTFLIDFGIVFAFLDEAVNIDFSLINWIPDWLPEGLIIKLFALFLGYGGGVIVYNIIKKKVKDVKTNS